MNLGSKILELRKEKNLTQEDLAASLGVTAATVSKWENGYTLPDVLMLGALADHFAVTTDALLGRARQIIYAVIAAETPALGQKVARLAMGYGILARSILTDYEQAQAAVREDDSIQYLICCYTSGFYGDCADATALVSVAPTEEELLTSITQVLDRYVKT